jgi:uncharacterized membrane protein YhfC
MIAYPVIASVAGAAILSALWPVAIFVICRRRMTLAGRNVLAGAGVFFLFAMVLEQGLHAYVLKGNPETAAWLHARPIWYALYGCCAAALFEETGRYLGMRFLVRPTGDPGTPVAYAIGHGGLESILIGTTPLLNGVIFALMFNAGVLDSTLKSSVPPDALAKIHGLLMQLSTWFAMVSTLERLGALLIQIGLSLLVWRAVERRQPGWLALAFLAHAVVDFFPGMAQAGQLSIAVVEGALMVISVGLIAVFLYGLPPRIAVPPAQPA